MPTRAALLFAWMLTNRPLAARAFRRGFRTLDHISADPALPEDGFLPLVDGPVLDHLEEGLDVNELPPSLVSSAVQEDLNRFAYSMAMRGMAPNAEDVNWQELAARLEPAARRRVLDDLGVPVVIALWIVRRLLRRKKPA